MKSVIILLLITMTFTIGCKNKYWDYSNKVQKICIEGHVYFKYENSISPKLTDDGYPVKCVVD